MRIVFYTRIATQSLSDVRLTHDHLISLFTLLDHPICLINIVSRYLSPGTILSPDL